MRGIIFCFVLLLSINTSWGNEVDLELLDLTPEDYLGQEVTISQTWCYGDVQTETINSEKRYSISIESMAGKDVFKGFHYEGITIALNKEMSTEYALTTNSGFKYRCTITAVVGRLTANNSSLTHWTAGVSKIEFLSASGDLLNTLSTVKKYEFDSSANPIDLARQDGFSAGKQACINSPSSCGITTTQHDEAISKAKQEGVTQGKNICINDPESCGIVINITNETVKKGALLTKEVIDGLSSGWWLLGTSHQINDLSIFDSAKMIWTNLDGEYYFYTADSNTKNKAIDNNYMELKTIYAGAGIWVKK